jgi:hypothetical protein
MRHDNRAGDWIRGDGGGPRLHGGRVLHREQDIEGHEFDLY